MSESIPTEQEVQSVIRMELGVFTAPPYRSYGLPEDLPYRTGLAAIEWLYSQGYISDPFRRSSIGSPVSYSLTPEGWGYWERLRLGPIRYWLKYNWFPMAVATTTVVVGICTILAQLLD